MRFLLVSAVVLLSSACPQQAASSPATPPPAPAPKAPQMVSGAQARAKVSAGATLLDVRTVDEFQELHIDGAKNLPLQELAGAMANVPKDKPVVVYCAMGSRSAAAAKMLAASGYDVYDLGGMGNWNQ